MAKMPSPPNQPCDRLNNAVHSGASSTVNATSAEGCGASESEFLEQVANSARTRMQMIEFFIFDSFLPGAAKFKDSMYEHMNKFRNRRLPSIPFTASYSNPQPAVNPVCLPCHEAGFVRRQK